MNDDDDQPKKYVNISSERAQNLHPSRALDAIYAFALGNGRDEDFVRSRDRIHYSRFGNLVANLLPVLQNMAENDPHDADETTREFWRLITEFAANAPKDR
jgi:hypothetical protein